MDKKTVFELQKKQYEHDQLFHQDILNLGTRDRLKHLVLHFVKYAARLENSVSQLSLQKNLVDSLICQLSMANVLNVELHSVNHEKNTDSFLKIIGQMAKACESLDHVEAFPSYEVLICEVKKLFFYTLNMADINNIELGNLIETRWQEVADKNIICHDKPITAIPRLLKGSDECHS